MVCKTYLRRTLTGPSRTVKVQQEGISPNQVLAIFSGSVLVKRAASWLDIRGTYNMIHRKSDKIEYEWTSGGDVLKYTKLTMVLPQEKKFSRNDKCNSIPTSGGRLLLRTIFQKCGHVFFRLLLANPDQSLDFFKILTTTNRMKFK